MYTNTHITTIITTNNASNIPISTLPHSSSSSTLRPSVGTECNTSGSALLFIYSCLSLLLMYSFILILSRLFLLLLTVSLFSSTFSSSFTYLLSIHFLSIPLLQLLYFILLLLHSFLFTHSQFFYHHFIIYMII
jgi:hypothetical protein